MEKLAIKSSLEERLEELIGNNSSDKLDPIDLHVNQIMRITKRETKTGPPFLKQWAFNLRLFLQSLHCIINSRFAPVVKVRFMLIISEPTHFNQLLPVLKLVSQNDLIWVTPKFRMYLKLRSLKQPVVFWSHYFSRGASAEKKTWLNKHSNFSPEEWQLLKDEVQKEWGRALQLIRPFNQFIKKHSPEYIFIGNDLTLEGRLATLLAKQHHIPTGMIQHGLIGNEFVNSWHRVDQFFLYGEAYKKTLIKDNVNSDRLIVTGAPYLDIKALNSTSKIHSKIARKFQIPENKEYILVALSGYGHRTSYKHYLILLETISNVSKKIDVPLIFKLHRKENIMVYHDTGKRLLINPMNIAVWDDPHLPKDIFDWFHGCKAVITGTSTVALEAMLCGIPVISLDLFHEYTGVHFIDQNASINVYSEEELLFQINEILSGRIANQVNRDKFIEDNFYKLDGQASNRIFHFVNCYLSNQAVNG